jgi:hypothetical protein
MKLGALITMLRSLVSVLVGTSRQKKGLAGLLLASVALYAAYFNLPGTWVTSTQECLSQILAPILPTTSQKNSPQTMISDYPVVTQNSHECRTVRVSGETQCTKLRLQFSHTKRIFPFRFGMGREKSRLVDIYVIN